MVSVEHVEDCFKDVLAMWHFLPFVVRKLLIKNKKKSESHIISNKIL